MPSNTSSNKAVVPEAKGALDRFKYEVANELGVPLTDGYNGNLTSKPISIASSGHCQKHNPNKNYVVSFWKFSDMTDFNIIKHLCFNFDPAYFSH